MIIQPNSIKAELNQTYIIDTNSEYVDDYKDTVEEEIDGEDKKYYVNETVLLNYK